MYSPPYNPDEIRKHNPTKAEWLLNDPTHLWRATTGVELIHEEPTLAEQIRIWKNWNEMNLSQKRQSDLKSQKLFGLTNIENHIRIMRDKWGRNKENSEYSQVM